MTDNELFGISEQLDTISRQAAVDAVERNACNTQRAIDAINNLPSAQPEPLSDAYTKAV